MQRSGPTPDLSTARLGHFRLLLIVLETGVSIQEKLGGPGRDRTDDLFHAMEARSQLRHRPTYWKNQGIGPDSILAYLPPGVKLI